MYDRQSLRQIIESFVLAVLTLIECPIKQLVHYNIRPLSMMDGMVRIWQSEYPMCYEMCIQDVNADVNSRLVINLKDPGVRMDS